MRTCGFSLLLLPTHNHPELIERFGSAFLHVVHSELLMKPKKRKNISITTDSLAYNLGSVS